MLLHSMTADLPHCRRQLHSPRHLSMAYSEMVLPGPLTGPPPLAVKKRLLNGCIRVCIPSSCNTTGVRITQSPVSVSSSLETFSGPAQDCSMLLNRGGIQKPSGDPKPPARLEDSGDPSVSTRLYLSTLPGSNLTGLGHPVSWVLLPRAWRGEL